MPPSVPLKLKTGYATTLPPRQGMRSSVALWVVFTSGLVVTLLAFFLLRTVLGDTLERQAQTLHNDIQSQIENHIDQIRDQMRALRLLVIPIGGETGLVQYLQARQEDKVDFDQVLWLSSGPSHQIERVLFKRHDVDMKLMATVQTSFLRIFDAVAPARKVGLTTFFVDVPGGLQEDSIRMQDKRYRRQYGFVAMAERSERSDGTQGFIVGLVPINQMIHAESFVHPRYDLDLSVSLASQGTIFTISPIGAINSTNYRHQSTFPVFDHRATLTTTILRSPDQYLMQVIPVIVLFIGFLLTCLGALYVRSNQKQALMLTKMNKTLALKNMEMNSQVTERERLNQTLRKTENEKRAIMDSVTDIIFEVDQNGRFLFLNEAWYRITGFPVEQSKGLNLFDMMTPSERATYRGYFEQVLVGQKSGTVFSTGILSAGDAYRQMQIRYSMIRMDDENNPRVVGTMTDIDEFRRAENALAEAEEKYRAIWENAVTGIYQVALDGTLISANPALARIFGYETPEDMVDNVTMMNKQLYASTKDRQVMLNRLLDDGRISNIESQGVRRDRSHFWMVESARAVRDDNGQIIYLEGSIDDITERKEAELRLKNAMTELELANRAKTEFLANMSHELRTPLNAIIGFSEIIKDEVFGKMEQRQYLDYARDIHDSGKNLLGIINTILDVSRIEAGDRQLNETEIAIPKLIQSVANLVQGRTDENHQTLRLDLADGLPRLWGEELAIKQILLNLLNNASKFTPSGGVITLAAHVDDAGDLHLIVADTGIGLDTEEIERVMAPFGQASGSFSRSSAGPGLGLTLVNALTRLHGGHFEMVSQKGVGTTATIILPASRLQH